MHRNGRPCCAAYITQDARDRDTLNAKFKELRQGGVRAARRVHRGRVLSPIYYSIYMFPHKKSHRV